MEWIKTILNAVRVAMDGVSAKVDRLNAWAKTFAWVPVMSEQDDVILQNTKITATDGNYMFTSTIPTAGATYNVTINGESYQATAKTGSNDGQTMTILGDYLVNPDGDLPFLFGWTKGVAVLYTSITSQDGSYVVSIIGRVVKANKLPEDFVPDRILNAVKDPAVKTNPVFTGSFSQNRKSGSTIGKYSHAEGRDTTASGEAAHAEGAETTASNTCAHTEGRSTVANADCSHAEGAYSTASYSTAHAEGSHAKATHESAHAEGFWTEASGRYSHSEGDTTRATAEAAHAEGYHSNATGKNSHAEGNQSISSGENSHAEGRATYARGNAAHSEGSGTSAYGEASHVQGRYNVIDNANAEKYAHIVGNGTSGKPSNAHTLDWAGVPWFQGRPQFGGTAQDNGSQSVVANGDKEFILASSTEGSTKKFKVTVDDSGTLKATEITN